MSLKSVKIQTTAQVTKDLRRQLLGLDESGKAFLETNEENISSEKMT